MSGWRDADGHTAADRKTIQRAEDRAGFVDRVRRRPMSLVKPILGAVFIAILIVALLNFLV
jgi:hypothetical protein